MGNLDKDLDAKMHEMKLRKRALDLVSTSVDDLSSSLPHLKSDVLDDIYIVKYAVEICQRREWKTKALLLGRKLRKMKKDIDTDRRFRLFLQE